MPMDDTLSQEQFFLFLEQEMRKIEEFTNKQVYFSIKYRRVCFLLIADLI